VSRNAECLTSTPPRSRSPIPQHQTGHDEPRRRPEDHDGRARTAELAELVMWLGSWRSCGAPALQTNGGPPRHTSGVTSRMHACNTIVTERHIPSVGRA
jgi:hypothetical protein